MQQKQHLPVSAKAATVIVAGRYVPLEKTTKIIAPKLKIKMNMKNYLFLLIMLLSFSCTGLLQKEYEVSEILRLKPRQLENNEMFKIKGRMGNAINLGVLSINAFALKDINNSDNLIYVHTEYKTMPANTGDLLNLKLKFWKEIDIGISRFYLFEEVKN